MKKNIASLLKFSATSALITLAVSTSYATCDTCVVNGLNTVNGTLQANGNLLSSYFGTLDPLFLALSSNTDSSTLNTVSWANNKAAEFSENTINAQLQTIPSALNVAYQRLSLSSYLGAATAPQDPLKNTINSLTFDMPSFDTLYLPTNTCTGTSTCLDQANPWIAKNLPTLKKNAQSLNFDGFFAPTSNAPNYAQGKLLPSTAQNYISYALQTYQPLVDSAPAVNTGGNSGDQDLPFFQALNKKLLDMDKTKANDYLLSILQDPSFQQYWINLRTLEAKRSMLVSNFNYLAAERTPKKGLGAAYNLPGLGKDASPVQVEEALVNSTVYNPKWYSNMKYATPATLQREQLLLTSLLVRLQYHNQQINERNLATQLISASSMLDQAKMGLQQQEAQLKALLNKAP